MAEQEQKPPTALTATVKSLGEFIAKYQEQISGLLPKHLDPQKMVRIAQVALSRNPKLLECTPLSILDCVIKAAQVGLELNGPMRQAFMVPYWNDQAKKLEAQFQIGYPGMIELASRSRDVSYVDAHPVFDGDFFQFEHGDKQYLKHKPNLNRENDDLHAAYAIIKFRDGNQMFEVLGKRDIMKLKARSQMGKKDKGPWETDESEMWRKSPIKKLLKRVRTSQELQAALGYDDQSELGLPQDAIIDFDFDNAKARLATAEKTEQLKDKLEKRRAEKTNGEENSPPVDESSRPREVKKSNAPAAPSQEAGSVPGNDNASLREKEKAQAGAPVDGNKQEPLFSEPAPPQEKPKPPVIEDRTITREEQLGLVEILTAKKATRSQVLNKLKEKGYERTQDLKVKDYAFFINWAQSLPEPKSA